MDIHVCPQCNKERNVSRRMMYHIKSGRSSGKCKPCSCKWSEEKREKMISIITGRKWSKESRNKVTGTKHYRWIDDRNLLKTEREKAYDTKYKYWMMEVKKRDKWVCRIADNNCNGRLEAHHILNWKEYPELRYEINNGITLCHAHHPRGRANEKRLSPYLQELVSVSKENFG